jgi:hypothetical protein
MELLSASVSSDFFSFVSQYGTFIVSPERAHIMLHLGFLLVTDLVCKEMKIHIKQQSSLQNR